MGNGACRGTTSSRVAVRAPGRAAPPRPRSKEGRQADATERNGDNTFSPSKPRNAHDGTMSAVSQGGAAAAAVELFHALDTKGERRNGLPALDVREVIAFLARQGLFLHIDMRLHPMFVFLVEDQGLDAEWLWRFCEYCSKNGGSGVSDTSDPPDHEFHLLVANYDSFDEEDLLLQEEEFTAMVQVCLATVRQAVHGQMAVRNFGRLKKVVSEIHELVRQNEKGENASYIPQLSEQNVPWNQFAISLTTIDGQHCSVGDSLNSFAIQSCSKPISFLCALRQFGVDYTSNAVGVEASGRPFNEVCLKQKEPGREIPHNPCINAGAICTVSMVYPELEESDRLLQLLEVWRSLSRGLRPVQCDDLAGKTVPYGPFDYEENCKPSVEMNSKTKASSTSLGSPGSEMCPGELRRNSGCASTGNLLQRQGTVADIVPRSLLQRQPIHDDRDEDDEDEAAEQELADAVVQKQMEAHVRACKKSMEKNTRFKKQNSFRAGAQNTAAGGGGGEGSLSPKHCTGRGGRRFSDASDKSFALQSECTTENGDWSGDNMHFARSASSVKEKSLYGDPEKIFKKNRVECLTASDMHINRAMYESESLTANGNWCLAHLMVARNSFPPCFHAKGEALVKRHNQRRQEMLEFAAHLKTVNSPPRRRNGGRHACLEEEDEDEEVLVVAKSTKHWITESTAPVSATELALKETLETYFQACSIMSNNRLMSTMAATLANCGRNVYTGTLCFGRKEISQVLPIMITAGMYDYSGQWSFDVGVPAKSGVGGCVYMVIPGLCGISVFSPRLDQNGNSVRGVDACTRLSEALNLNTLSSLQPPVANKAKQDNSNGKLHVLDELAFDPRRGTDPVEEQVARVLKTAAWGDVQELTRLFKAGVDFSAGDYDQRTALHVAAAEGHANIVHFLLLVLKPEQQTSLDRWGQSPADGVANRRVARILEKAHVFPQNPVLPDLHENGMTEAYTHLEFSDEELPILWTASREEESSLDELIMFNARHGPEKLVLGADYDKRTCFHLAVSCRALKNVRYLLVQARKCNALSAMLQFRDRMGGTGLSDLERESAKESEQLPECQAIWELLRQEIEDASNSCSQQPSRQSSKNL
ncbi:unnamed protein product [Amoebophrya sp. A120]|nr:unnamed protein product [Amoebophrya sp. A120]|eukprot:GSA120T00024002001.1